MSRNEWERGEIRLPTSEFARLRQILQKADTDRKEGIFGHTQSFWGGLTAKEKRDPQAYREALRRYTGSLRKPRPGHLYPTAEASAMADAVGERLHLRYGQDKPRRVLRADMDFPTNRTTGFRLGEAGIAFDRDNSTVHWDVPRNNHAVDTAHGHPLAQAFFSALDDIRWTRGTGGWVSGSNEYRDEHADPDLSAAAVSSAWGPLGAQHYPGECKPFVDSQGRRVTRELLAEASSAKFAAEYKAAQAASRAVTATLRGGAQGRQPKGRPVGGQYTGRSYGEAGFRL